VNHSSARGTQKKGNRGAMAQAGQRELKGASPVLAMSLKAPRGVNRAIDEWSKFQ